MVVRMHELYRSNWGVFDSPDDDDSVHVAPMFGPLHDMSRRCWCHPETDASEMNVVVHNIAQ